MPVEVGDTCCYANGNEYVITDGGPTFTVNCFLCGATAGATAEVPVRSVRCGQCWAKQHELLPGQRIYELKEQYVRDHPLPRYVRSSVPVDR